MWKTFGGKIQKSGMGIAMQQLECRFYPRQEIAEALSVNPKDSKHFAERVKTTLDKWGYEYEYSRSGVEITGKPETAEERLREILIRKLNLDVQIDAYAFACFICAFTDIGSFDSMPWEERAELIRRNPSYGTIICRCENVSEGEIVDAINRTLGAKSLDGIKRRVRQGMGRCQAGFCSPRTMEILARERHVSMFDITKSGGNSRIVTDNNKDSL